jgi:hypothetical protein
MDRRGSRDERDRNLATWGRLHFCPCPLVIRGGGFDFEVRSSRRSIGTNRRRTWPSRRLSLLLPLWRLTLHGTPPLILPSVPVSSLPLSRRQWPRWSAVSGREVWSSVNTSSCCSFIFPPNKVDLGFLVLLVCIFPSILSGFNLALHRLFGEDIGRAVDSMACVTVADGRSRASRVGPGLGPQ